MNPVVFARLIKFSLFIYLFRVRITFKHRKRIRLAKPFTNAPANKEQNLH